MDIDQTLTRFPTKIGKARTGQPSISVEELPLLISTQLGSSQETLPCEGTGICLFRALVDNLPDPVYFKDHESRFTAVNSAMAELCGCDRPEMLIGKSDIDLFTSEHAAEAHADEQDLLHGRQAAVRKEEKETWPDGHESWAFTTKLPLRDRAGRIVGTFGISKSITARKRAEEELRQQLAVTKTITDNAVSCLFMMDKKGHATFANPAAERVTGYTLDEIRDMPLHDAIHHRYLDGRPYPMSECPIENAVAAMVSLNDYEDVFVRKDGSLFPAVCAIGPLEQNGEVTGAVLEFRDVTALKEAEGENERLEAHFRLAQKLEALGALSAGIAHEINTPTQYVGDNIQFLHGACKDIRGLIGKYQALADAVKNSRETAALIEDIEMAEEEADLSFLLEEVPMAIEQSTEGIARVSKIVNAMKRFSHLDQQEKSLADLNQAVESTTTISRNEWKYAADLELDMDPDLPPVPCLVGEINQVILNLIVNAAHAIAETAEARANGMGKIRVSTRAVEGTVEIRVADNGPGIPKAIRDKVFDPFFTTKELGKGTGQGLALAHNIIVRKHNGSIRFETKTGQGTTFIIRLPVE